MGTVAHTDFLRCADQGAVPAHVSSVDTLEVPTYVGSSDVGFSVVGSIIGVKSFGLDHIGRVRYDTGCVRYGQQLVNG